MRPYPDGVGSITLQCHHLLVSALEVKHPAASPLLTVQGIKGMSRERQCEIGSMIGKVGNHKCQLTRTVAEEGILSPGIQPVAYRIH